MKVTTPIATQFTCFVDGQGNRYSRAFIHLLRFSPFQEGKLIPIFFLVELTPDRFMEISTLPAWNKHKQCEGLNEYYMLLCAASYAPRSTTFISTVMGVPLTISKN